MTTTNFIIYGNNSGGSSVVGLSIKILEPAPTITYQTDSLVLIRGEAMPSALEAILVAERWRHSVLTHNYQKA